MNHMYDEIGVVKGSSLGLLQQQSMYLGPGADLVMKSKDTEEHGDSWSARQSNSPALAFLLRPET